MDAVLKNHIGGAWVPSHGVETIDVLNPATEELLAVIPAGSAADADDAVASAVRAAGPWAALDLEERLRHILAWAQRAEDHASELAALERDEMGRPMAIGHPFAAGGAGLLRASVDEARDYAFVEEVEHGLGGQSLLVRHPLGAIALIVPWNFTVTTILMHIGPLLASGNTVILKPSEKAPLSAVRLIELAEFPPGVLNMVLGDGRAGAALSAHPSIALTHFTGSIRSGRSVAIDNAGHLRRAVLELGGKDPVVIDAGVDIAVVAKDVAAGCFVNSGQICTSMERIYVHRDIADAFVDALVDEARAYTFDQDSESATLLGPLVDDGQRQVVARHVDDAIARGATVRLGGRVPDGPGFFYPATVLTGVTDDMLVMTEETFGPVAPVQVVDSFEEGLAKAAASEYGLAATVYSRVPEHLEAAHAIPAAMTWINQWRGGGPVITYEPAKHSGVGATGTGASFDAATRPAMIFRTAESPRAAVPDTAVPDTVVSRTDVQDTVEAGTVE